MPKVAAKEAATAKATKKIRHSTMEHPRHQYPEETAALQSLAQSCGLTETVKWGKPCYTLGGKNIVLIQRFNDYIALLFFNGALLKDPQHLLTEIGEMQAPRHLRFTSVEQIEDSRDTIAAFLREAMALENSGAKIPHIRAADVPVPAELDARFQSDPALKKAFAILTPGRQKAYLFQIAAAKQPATRTARIDKFAPRILAGKGLLD